jgi:hypothetical protein
MREFFPIVLRHQHALYVLRLVLCHLQPDSAITVDPTCAPVLRFVADLQGVRYFHQTVYKNVTIPPGADSNYLVTYAGMAHAGPFVTPGNVRFVVNALEHPSFVRTGADLTIETQLSLREALFGWSRCVEPPRDTRT